MEVTQAHVVALRAKAAAVARETKRDVDSVVARIASGYQGLSLDAASRHDSPRASDWTTLLGSDIDTLQPLSERRPTYDLTAYLAKRCVDAYEHDLNATVKPCIEKQGGSDFAAFAHWPDAAFVYRKGRTGIIVFRGTVPKNIPQWFLTDFFTLPLIGTPGRHIGFELAWRRMKKDVLGWIGAHVPPDGDVVITGHSLGAAMSLLCGYDLVCAGHRVRAIVTLGTPRVGLSKFRDAFLNAECYARTGTEQARKLSDVTRRITHADDLVSRIPPPPLFRHVGEEHLVSEHGYLREGSSRTSFARIFSSFDEAVGSIYERLDKSRKPATRPLGSMVLKTENRCRPVVTRIHPLARPTLAVTTMGKRSATGRLVDDTVEAHRVFPFSALIPAQLAYIGLMAVGVLLGGLVLLLGLCDLIFSHPSGKYVSAFKARYDAKTIMPTIRSITNAAFAGTLRKIRDAERDESEPRPEPR